MKKAIFIIPYFGELPEYFSLWEQSVSKNLEYDFIIFTDSELSSIHPNIFVKKIEFGQFLDIFNNFFNEQINVKKPYKLCDLRPMYGEVLNHYIKDYLYWGYCDLDMCMGNLSNFIGDYIDNRIPKIGRQGHMTLMLNDKKINGLYRSDKGIFNYREVLNNEELYAFDEMAGINYICDQEEVTSVSIDSADISPIYKSYKDVRDNSRYQLFYYKDEHCYKMISEDGISFSSFEVAAVHFQKKNPIILPKKIEKNRTLVFTENKIIYGNIGLEQLENMTKKCIFIGKKIYIEKQVYKMRKIKELLLKGPNQISIRIKSNKAIKKNLKKE